MKYKNYIFFLSIIILFSCTRNEDESFAYGNFEAQDIIVSSEVSGIIEHFTAEEGDRVERNELIGIIDTTRFYLQIQQLEANSEAIVSGLAELEAQIKVEEINLENLQREYQRFQNMREGGAATEKQLDEIKGQLEMVKAKIEALKTKKKGIYSNLKANKMRIEQVEDQLEECKIQAPAGGTILEVFLREGELAAPGRAIFKMAWLDEMTLRVFISGDQLSAVKVGNEVNVLYDGPGGDIRNTRGIITWISSQAEFTPKIIQTREERVNLVYAVKVKVPNDGSLKIGMPGEINLEED